MLNLDGLFMDLEVLHALGMLPAAMPHRPNAGVAPAMPHRPNAGAAMAHMPMQTIQQARILVELLGLDGPGLDSDPSIQPIRPQPVRIQREEPEETAEVTPRRSVRIAHKRRAR